MNTWLWFLLLFVFASVLFRLVKKEYAKRKSRLHTHGFQVLDCLSDNDVNYLKSLWDAKENDKIKKFLHSHPGVLKKIQHLLGPEYIFQDYIFLIEKSRIHTCHRDVNAQQLNPDVKHPSYTRIFYLEEMERCLDVIPKSDQSKLGVYLTDETNSIKCRPGNAVLFNSGLIHAGSMNENPNNKRIQMKVTHRDDVKALNYFQNYNKKLESENENPELFNVIQKHMSCQVPIVSDLFKSEAAKPVEKLFSSIFYGNENFYDLSDISKKNP